MAPLNDNLLQMLRMSNVFDPRQVGPNLETGQGTFTGQPMLPGREELFRPQVPLDQRPPGIVNPQMVGEDIGFDRPTRQVYEPDNRGMLESLYTPDTRFSGQYEEHMKQFPERNEPGFLRNLGALLGNREQGNRIRYGPYNRELADWTAKAKALEPGMTAERYGNANERMLAYQTESNRLREAGIDRQAEADRRRADTADKNAESRRIRDEAYAAFQKFRIENPDLELSRGPEGGNYQVFNPKTGEMEDTGIKNGTLDPVQEINLRVKGQMQVAAVPRTVVTSGTSTTVTPPEAENPTQAKQRMINNASKLMNENPAYREVIEFDQNGLPIVKPVGTVISGNILNEALGGTPRQRLTEEDFNRINEAINTGKPITGPTTTRSSRTTTTRSGTTAGSPGRNAAIAELKKMGYDNPNEAMITEAMKDLGLE